MENPCSRRQRTQQSSGNRNTDRGGRGRGATREGRRRGEAEGGAWAETTPPGHVIQGNAPAHGGSPTQSTEREGQQSSHKDAGLVSVSGEEVLLTERGKQQMAGTIEPPSGPASRRHVPWSRLLLAGERGQFSGRGRRLENESLAGPWGRRGSERGQGASVQT